MPWRTSLVALTMPRAVWAIPLALAMAVWRRNLSRSLAERPLPQHRLAPLGLPKLLARARWLRQQLPSPPKARRQEPRPLARRRIRSGLVGREAA
jgi:hypothetical protein